MLRDTSGTQMMAGEGSHLAEHIGYRLQIKTYRIQTANQRAVLQHFCQVLLKTPIQKVPHVSTGKGTIINVFHIQNLSQKLHDLQHIERAWSYRLVEP